MLPGLIGGHVPWLSRSDPKDAVVEGCSCLGKALGVDVGHNQGLPDSETALGLFPPGCPTSLVSVLFLGLSWSTGWAL